MKKILSKIAGVALAAFVATGFMACPTPNGSDDNPDSPSGTIWEGATIVEELADKEISWGKDANDAEISCMLPLKYSSRLQKDSKIIVQLDYNNIKNDYIEFHVDDGSWGAVGVTDYYSSKGVKLDSEEEVDGSTGTGRYKVKVEPGVYYTVVTESVLAKLQSGCGFNGNFKLVKVGLTNLAAEVEVKEAEDGDVVYEATGDALNISVAANSYDTGDGKGNIVRGIQFAGSGATYLPAGAIAGDVYEINLAGKADEEFTSRVQFLDSSWQGLVQPAEGEETTIPLTTFTTADFDLKLKVKFTKNTADGFKFVIGKDEEGAATRTLTLTKFTITKVSSGTAEPASDEPEVVEAKTVGACTSYEITVNKNVDDASKVVLVLQADSPDTDEGLTINITDFEFTVKVGDADATTISKDSISLTPNKYGETYESKNAKKTDIKVELGLTGELAENTKIVLQAKKATISGAEPSAIVFAVQNTSDWSMIAADSEIYKKFFTEVTE